MTQKQYQALKARYGASLCGKLFDMRIKDTSEQEVIRCLSGCIAAPFLMKLCFRMIREGDLSVSQQKHGPKIILS